MNAKRPIDRLRESAGKIEVGAADDNSVITAMISISDVLYIVKENGIYAVKLADSIDPDRLNPHIPNIQQRVFTCGSTSELVGRTLLTANSLFKNDRLPPTIDCEQAVMLSLEALKDIVAMQEVKDAFQRSERAEIDAFNNRQHSQGALIMPAIGNVLERCKTFIQKADHVSKSLFNIVKLFYGKNVGAKGFESLANLAVREYGENDTFTKFAKDVAPRLKYIRNVRDCIEHPQPPTQVATVNDFNLGPDGKISHPMIQVHYRKEHYPPVQISLFMEDSVDGLSAIFETMLAYLCSKHVQSFGNFQTQVMELPTERRQQDNKHVRFSYGIEINGQMTPLG
jgi:hypothetical protein